MVDGTVRNPAVSAAYAKGEYTTKNGMTYRRGMDGWFSTLVQDTENPDTEIMVLVRHHDMAELIAKEAEADDGGE